MNTEQYVNKIVKKVRCGGARKKEIKKELLADFNCRLEQGEQPEDILAGMGSVEEIAQSFNENLSEQEKKAFRIRRLLCIALPVLAVLLLLSVVLYRVVPRSVDIEKSRYFDKAQVEAAIRDAIELFEQEDYEALRQNAIESFDNVMTKEKMDEVRGQMSAAPWGERQSVGTVYVAEIAQGDKHFAMGQVTVVYENINVTYTLTYDTDMQLAGFFMK